MLHALSSNCPGAVRGTGGPCPICLRAEDGDALRHAQSIPVFARLRMPLGVPGRASPRRHRSWPETAPNFVHALVVSLLGCRRRGLHLYADRDLGWRWSHLVRRRPPHPSGRHRRPRNRRHLQAASSLSYGEWPGCARPSGPAARRSPRNACDRACRGARAGPEMPFAGVGKGQPHGGLVRGSRRRRSLLRDGHKQLCFALAALWRRSALPGAVSGFPAAGRR